MSSVRSTQDSEPEYAWELATLYPAQGAWSEDEYLDLTDRAKRRIEFADGRLEFPAMPTEVHEALVRFLFLALYHFVDRSKLGEVYSNGIRIRIRPAKIRIPDVLFLHKNRFHLRHNRVWDGADLVMEVVSDEAKDRQRDFEAKLRDYSEANIAEYWIVDAERRQVVVHQLHNTTYRLHGTFAAGNPASSVVLPGFTVDTATLFQVIDGIPQ